MKDEQGFSENLWLDVLENGQGRQMKLLAAFTYTDKDGMRHTAPRDMVFDGGSIPRFFWRVIGSPYTGRARRAYPIHDLECGLARSAPTLSERWAMRKGADKLLHEMCVFLGVAWWRCAAIYRGVRIGAVSVMKKPANP